MLITQTYKGNAKNCERVLNGYKKICEVQQKKMDITSVLNLRVSNINSLCPLFMSVLTLVAPCSHRSPSFTLSLYLTIHLSLALSLFLPFPFFIHLSVSSAPLPVSCQINLPLWSLSSCLGGALWAVHRAGGVGEGWQALWLPFGQRPLVFSLPLVIKAY